MDLKNYAQGDESKILELFKLVFNQELTHNQWLWRFRHNPAGKHLIKLMWDGDKLVGHYAVSPIYMRVEGEDVLTAHSLTTMTHPDYGGRGVFKQLSSALYEELENEMNCKAIWGYPNNNSHYGFVKSLKWSNIAVLHTLGISAKDVKSRNDSLQVIPISKFDQSHASFIHNKLDSNFKAYVRRDVNYLNWRYVEKPVTEYRRYQIESEYGKGIVVAKVYPSGSQNQFDLNIVECFLDSFENIHDIIDYIMKDFNLSFSRVTIWKNLFDKDHLWLERNRFVPVLPQTYLAARIHQSMPDSFSDYRSWFTSMGDSDVF